MAYIDPNGNYPRYIGDIQLENPEWSAGDDLPSGWIEVLNSEIPVVEENQVGYEGTPTEVDGIYYQNWQVRDLTSEEIAYRDAPITAAAKLEALGFTRAEITALTRRF